MERSELNSAFLGGCTTKSGVPLEGIDRQKIDEIILEASKGSKFYQFQQKRERRIAEKVATLQTRLSQLERDPILVSKAQRETLVRLQELETGRVLGETFVHIDMDAFYAAVETLKRPELAQLPMAVGGDSMLCTANYVARQFGVVSAMPGYIARKLCRQLVILPPDFTSYRKASEKVQAILRDYDPNFYSFSLDEAGLNLTNYLSKNAHQSAEAITSEIRRRIFESTHLTCSAGIAANRQLAKMCSNEGKPDGQFCLAPHKDTILTFLRNKMAKNINGVGKVTSKILKDLLQIETCHDIIEKALWVRLLFSSIQADFLLRSALGLGGAAFGEDSSSWNRKSMSVERTFRTVREFSEMDKILTRLCQQLADDLAEEGIGGKTVGIKMKSSNFEVQTRAITLDHCIYDEEQIYKYASKLLIRNRPQDLRLLGVRMSGLLPLAEMETIKYRALDEFVKDEHLPDGVKIDHPPCPVCAKVIEAHPNDTLRINEHVDRCLNATNQPVTLEPIMKVKKQKNNLDKFFKLA